MGRKYFALTIVLALAAGFAGRSLADARWLMTGVEVNAASLEADPEVPQWEYCAVLKAQYPGSIRGGLYWISYFRGERIETIDIEAGVTGNGLSKAISKLGSEGWELVGQGPLEVRQGAADPRATALFFKRRKTEK